jgi:hypothetical protein
MPPADAPPLPAGFTVADLARRWRVGEDKVRAFLRKGELVAVNVAACLAGKPQWRITAESVKQFEQRRSSVPTPKPVRRRRQVAEVDFYPD